MLPLRPSARSTSYVVISSVSCSSSVPSEIHLVGNYIGTRHSIDPVSHWLTPRTEQPVPFNNGDDSENEDDEFGSEDGYDLRDVSSDVEMDADELLSDEECVPQCKCITSF